MDKRKKRKLVIKTVSIEDDIEIMGHVFHGIWDVRRSITNYSRIYKSREFDRLQWVAENKQAIDGIYILDLYEPFPKFDADDDDRAYSNFFFSKTPFSSQRINHIADMEHGINAQIVKEGMDPELAPAIYWDENYKTMVVAFLE